MIKIQEIYFRLMSTLKPFLGYCLLQTTNKNTNHLPINNIINIIKL